MAFRPNFDDTVRITGASMLVAGESDDDPLPVDIQVFLEQEGRVAGRSVDKPTTAWRATLSSQGFGAGPALAFGVEIRTQPFLTTTWSQAVTIE